MKSSIFKIQIFSDTEGIFLIARTYFLIFLIPVFYSYFPSNILLILGVFFIAARAHSLYELNHEASHNKLSKNKGLNDLLAIIFCNVPFFHHPESYSFYQWKRIHLLHHKYLATEKDPNYLTIKRQGLDQRPLTSMEIFKYAFLNIGHNFKSLFFGKQDYVKKGSEDFKKNLIPHLRLLFFPIKYDHQMEKERKIKWAGFLIILLTIHLLGLWKLFFLFWIIPLYTIFPFILKIMDLTEHNWWERGGDLNKNSNSTRANLLTKIFISDLGRMYHREHHIYPNIPGPKIHLVNTDSYGQ